MNIFLWVILTLCIILYRWVGKVYVGQPKGNHPKIFWKPAAAIILLYAPMVGLAVVVIAGFLITENGWWFLGATILASIVFAPPRVFF